jgi:uncharacterized protein (DUF1501 family)
MFFPPHRQPTRRQALGAGLLGTLGLALSPAFQRLLAAEGPSRRAKNCILVWLNGGPSHLDTFDPKPDAGDEYHGPTGVIDTSVAGVRFSGYLPRLAQQAGNLAVVRTLTSKEADHDRANFFMHTGNLRSETVDYPYLGSVAAKTWEDDKDELPNFVAINGAGGDGGFFGVEYSAHVIGNLDAPIDNLALPDGVDEERLNRRLKGLDALNQSFARRSDAGRVADHERFHAKALRLRTSPALEAFDLTKEKPETLTAYGADAQDPTFGKACLMARRLVEHGVKFVEVMLDGWDTHADNFNAVSNLCATYLDPTLAALFGDLSDRGMLKDTLVLCVGEFGRTPKVNEQAGRDHWSEAFSAVLAGGGVKGGQVIGQTDEHGENVKDRPVTIPDFFATLLTALGVDPARQYRTPGGRPIKLADKGKVVTELFS